jgi:AcrR family transcriptional regulator
MKTKAKSSRVPAGERRQQILAIATELFARNGFQGVTTRQVAERARVNEAILFRHFPSKKDLYWAVIEAKCASMAGHRAVVDQLATATDERAAFTALALDLLERYSQDTTLMRLLLFSGLEAHELTERFFQTYIADYYEVLAKYIRRRIKAGEFRNVDPLLAARSFLGMVNHYLMVQELFGGKRYQKFDLRKVAETITTIWLEGMKER